MFKRLALVALIALCALAALAESADARYWRRGGWGGYPYGYGGWGWYDWPQYYRDGPYGPGYYNPYGAYPLPQRPRPVAHRFPRRAFWP